MLRLLDTAEFPPDFFTVVPIHAGPGSVWKWAWPVRGISQQVSKH